MQKRWIARSVPESEDILKLKEEIAVSDTLLSLMLQRNITSLGLAQEYFNPTITQLHDPFLMKGMQEAIHRIQKAMENEENILIYGDYDVDGTTAVATVYSFFANFTDKLFYYIPDRFTEGYGVSFQSLKWAAERNISLIISLDCGIKSLEQVAEATTRQIDFIVCDHHTPGDEIPKAVAVLNPKQIDCPYPFKELSGCGIGFKLIQAYAKFINSDMDIQSYLDLTAISIASDIVPIVGENRILAYFGLNQINTQPRPGVKALILLSGAPVNMNITDLVFKLGPRINAAGRIASGNAAVAMLIETSEEAAIEKAAAVNKTNTDRQSVDLIITNEALAMINDNVLLHNRRTTVLFNKDWHKGVIGIVASRLIEKYYRPTVMLTESNGHAVGSARSVPGFNLYAAIAECSHLLDQWGGHQAAAGLSMSIDKVEEFTETFERIVNEMITEEQLTPVLTYDLDIPLSSITLSFCKTLERFGPFGPENMRPVFTTRNVRHRYSPKIVGKNHIQLQLTADDCSEYFKGIAFGFGEQFNALNRAKYFDICYSIEPNEYKGNYSLNLNIKDIKLNASNINPS
jgi:single-stranded-DNA-specific exonuclease